MHFLGWQAIQSQSPTYDEPVHLTAGYSYWKTGDFRYNGYHHPVLGEMWCALPLLFLNPILPRHHSAWINQTWAPSDQYVFADVFVYKNRVSHDRLLSSGRVMQLVLSLILGGLLLVAGLKLALNTIPLQVAHWR